MTTIQEALDTITKTIRQNEPGELAREIRLLRAEIARLSAEVAALKSRPQAIPHPYPVYPPYYPPYYPPPILPAPRVYPGTWYTTSTATDTAPLDHSSTTVTLSARDVAGFRQAADVVNNLSWATDRGIKT